MTSTKAPGPVGLDGNPGSEAVMTKSIIPADDGKPDPDLLTDAEWTAHVNSAYDQAEGAMRRTMGSMRESVEWAVYLGRCLSEAKENRCRHGAWGVWLAEHCKVSQRTATRYMRVSRRMVDVDESNWPRAANLSLRQLEVLLAEPEPVKKRKKIDQRTDVRGLMLNDSAQREVLNAPVEARKDIAERASKLTSKRDKLAIRITQADVKNATTQVLYERAIDAKSESIGIAPEKLRAAAAARDQFADVLKQLHAVRIAALGLARSELGAFIGSQDIEIELKNVWRQIKYGRPYCACVYCVRASGMRQGCKRCHQLGWISKAALKLAPLDFQEDAEPFKGGKVTE